ncbi:MAG: hypothetical protein KKH12_14915 [Gammaproteobacteria bacterium]|nr:hypothetical protein [Gammaproteobacteria bacterium]MBU1482953.1 hypothetical protein [Gammaproteobacteria bacterium]
MKFSPRHLLLAFLALIPFTAGAETIYLKDGTSITGKIKSVGTDAVVMDTAIGEMTIESANISKLDRTNKETIKEEVPIKTNADWRMQQKDGLGFGLGATLMPGIIFFYDRNLSTTSQWHTQLDLNAMSRTNVNGDEIIKTQRNMLLTTYRHFFDENSGFYIGAGGGYADSKFEYNNPSPYAPYQYTSKASGVFLLGEIGWQGTKGYYFHVGLQPAAYISSTDDFDINNIPSVTNNRSSANKEHDALKQLSQISVGFGWFF